MPYFEPLTTSHRVTMHGRLLRCPHCSHVSRVYHLGFSTLQCIHCKTMVRKYDWTVGPNVTRKDLQPTYRWKAQRDRCSIFGKTKKILMLSNASLIKSETANILREGLIALTSPIQHPGQS